MLKPFVCLSSLAGVCGALGEIGELDVCEDIEHCHCETLGRTVGGC